MKAILISIGNELLNGSTLNTNATYLAKELYLIGYNVDKIFTIADGFEALKQTLNQFDSEPSICIVTGGLGPTPDDTTRFDISRYIETPLEERPELVEHILTIMGEERGRDFLKENRVQTLIPAGAEILPNPVGTAVGFSLKHRNCHFFFTPGVPFETQRIFKDHIIPQLSPAEPWIRKELVTYGIGESLQTRLLESVDIASPLVFASLPSSWELLLRLSAPATHIQQLNQTWEQILEAMRPYRECWTSLSGEKLLQTVSAELIKKSKTLSVAESCTGGGLGAALTSVSGSSHFFKGGVQAYSNSVKENLLNVNLSTLEQHGAVSEPCAREMADGVRQLISTDLAISITGIAGPNGGTVEKPVGTICFALSSNEGTYSETQHFRGDREIIRQRSILHALYMVHKKLHK